MRVSASTRSGSSRSAPRRRAASAAPSRSLSSQPVPRATSCWSTPAPRSRVRRARWRHDDEVHGRVPRRGARPGARREDPRRRRAGPPLQGDGGLRRPHPLDLQVRDRRPAPRERRAGPRPGLPGLRDPDGPRRRRDRDGDRERHHLHLLRRHDARAGLGEDAHRRQGRRRRHPDGLLAARRAPAREAEPGPRGRLLRDRLRDHRPLDRADAEAGQGRGRHELLLHVQPRHDRAAAAGAARLPRPPPRRLHRPGARLDRRRRAGPSSSSPRTTASRSSSRASSRSTSCTRSG